MADVFYVASDRKRSLSFEYTGVNITSYSAITLVVKRPDGSVIQRSGTIDDGLNGRFHFDWQAGDLQTGTSHAEVRLTDSGGLEETIPLENPLRLIVRARVS